MEMVAHQPTTRIHWLCLFYQMFELFPISTPATQSSESAIPSEQFGGCVKLDNLSMTEHQNPVVLNHSPQSMGNRYDRCTP